MADKQPTDFAPDEAVNSDREYEGNDSVNYPYGPEGPDANEVDSLKAKYGELQMVRLANRLWVYRQMNRKEHLELLEKGLMDLDSDALVVQTLLVWPSLDSINFETEAAGVVPNLSAAMLVFSGFVQTEAPVTL